MKITSTHWGHYKGQEVDLIHCALPDGTAITLSNYGALLQSFVVPLSNGGKLDVILGYETLQAYVDGPDFLGASIGPIADRLAQGHCVLAGQLVQLGQNAPPDAMHSGPDGFHAQVWDWAVVDHSIQFTLNLQKGQHAFPGNIQAQVRYTLTDAKTLRIDYQAQSDAEMAFNLTNHNYFNLSGAASDCSEHQIFLASDTYARTRRTEAPIVTGELVPVDGTPFDFRSPLPLASLQQHSNHPEVKAAGGLDHYFAIRGIGLREMATIANPQNGLLLRCLCDADGVQVYGGNGLSGLIGKGGIAYTTHYGICLEPQQIPNAVNFEQHRGRVLFQPGQTYRSSTVFSVEQT